MNANITGGIFPKNKYVYYKAALESLKSPQSFSNYSEL